MTEHDCEACKTREVVGNAARETIKQLRTNSKDMAPVMNCCKPTFDAWLAAFRAHKTGIACAPLDGVLARELERQERHAWWEHQQHRRKKHK